jgi:hypothetical protein
MYSWNSSFEICMPHQSMASARTPRNLCISSGNSTASVASSSHFEIGAAQRDRR